MGMLAFLLLLPNLSFAQGLHTFKNGEVADAEKINQNFNYVLENASGDKPIGKAFEGVTWTGTGNSVLFDSRNTHGHNFLFREGELAYQISTQTGQGIIVGHEFSVTTHSNSPSSNVAESS